LFRARKASAGEETLAEPLKAGAAPPYQPPQEKDPPDAQGSRRKEDWAENQRRSKGYTPLNHRKSLRNPEDSGIKEAS